MTPDPAGGTGRRDLLAAAGAFLATASLPGLHVPGLAPRRLEPAIQLYSLRTLLQQRPEPVLTQLAAIGYRRVELAGTYGRTPAAFRAMLDAAGLAAISAHVGLDAVTDRLDRTLDDAHALGCRYLVVPWLDAEQRTADGYARAAGQLNRAGERAARAGMLVGYHNHEFEFAPLDGGRCGYDVLLDATDPTLVTMQLDLFWIRQAGRDALAYFAAHPGRFRLVHVKDRAADGRMVDVGDGAMDWKVLLAAARRAGVTEFIAEHDEPTDALRFARRSWDVLHALRA